MNCPVCNRTLAPTLSICLTCGAMMNDSVREELQTKIGAPLEKTDPPPVVAANPISRPKLQIPRPSPPLRNTTSGLAGPRTSPTLVEFQSRNSTLPDWRLQLQNSVRQRKGNTARSDDGESAVVQTRLITNGANALKAEIVEHCDSEHQAAHLNPKIANALKRIDQSRKTFLPENGTRSTQRGEQVGTRSFPFNVVSRNAAEPRSAESRPVVGESPKPRLVPTFKIEKRSYDTNKL